jgi:hypothetical protein
MPASCRGRRALWETVLFGRSRFVPIGLAALAALVACDRPGSAPREPARDGAADRVDVADADAGVDGGHACVGSPLRAYEESAGVLQRVYVDLPIAGRTMPFFVDTGSPQSSRRLDAATDAGPGSGSMAKETPTTISCMEVGLAFSRASVFATTPDGRAVGGVLGTDLLTVGGVLDLRIRDSLFVWSGAVPPLPPATITLPATLTTSSAPYGGSKLVVEGIALDGKKVRLLVDTGSPHVVIVSRVPRANEIELDTFDGSGARVKFYESTIDLSYGGGPAHRVTVDRAASFPTLERVLATIEGAEVTGVLGIGALGHERIVISKDAIRFVL